MLQMNANVISAQENETTISIDHFALEFSVYTTARRVSSLLKRQFPSFYKEAEDGGSASANAIPLSQITKLHLSGLKSAKPKSGKSQTA